MLEILFEDDHLLIINKPAGIPVHASHDPKRENLEQLVNDYLKPNTCILPHRLDKDTSGAILFLKNKELAPKIQEQLKNRSMQKTYLALIEGQKKFKENEELKDFVTVKKVKGQDRLVKVDKGGDIAKLEIQNFKNFSDSTLIWIKLLTGRMHQIRAQLSFRKMPIIGDPWYDGAEYKRMMLHSFKLSLIHPMTAEIISVTAPSKDFEEYLA